MLSPIISLEMLQEWEQQSTFGSSRTLKRQQGSIGRRYLPPLGLSSPKAFIVSPLLAWMFQWMLSNIFIDRFFRWLEIETKIALDALVSALNLNLAHSRTSHTFGYGKLFTLVVALFAVPCTSA
jgi:hypothetical protein